MLTKYFINMEIYKILNMKILKNLPLSRNFEKLTKFFILTSYLKVSLRCFLLCKRLFLY